MSAVPSLTDALLPAHLVPVPSDRSLDEAADRLAEVLGSRRTVVLTGAGCSTESGIPDYRGPVTGARLRRPITGRTFEDDAVARRRYWARSFVGWPRVAAAVPNEGHRALASLEEAGRVTGLITQNVDRLHRQAGSRRVVELHGALEEVRCLGCGALTSRVAVQARLAALNPGFGARPEQLAPDGDVDLAPEEEAGFRVAACEQCEGMLKPAVVFFGETVPRAVVEAAWSMLDRGEALLVVGSSLTVFSGFRFVRRAAAREWPIAILNVGPTRGDRLARVRVPLRAAPVLARLAECLDAGAG